MKEKGKFIYIEKLETQNPPQLVRRISRLRKEAKKPLPEVTKLVDLKENLEVPSPIISSPTQDPSRRTPEIDAIQQEIYDYIEYLEK